MKTPLWAFALVILATLLISLAGVFMKLAGQRLPDIITNWPILAALVCYGLSTLLLIYAFKGGEVTTLYPVVATAYFWVTLLSIIVFNEFVSVTQWIGVAIIIAGVLFITSEKNRVPY